MMMKKLLLTAVAILGASAAYSQVGIGTRTPNNSSQLEVTVDGQPEKRGILIPRVALQNTGSMDPIVNSGTLPNSLLVFNTAVSGAVPFGVTPGYYYWYDNKWHRMVNDSDDANTTNVSLTQDGQNLVLTDSDGNSVRIALLDLQKITTLVNNGNGTYTYTSENGTVTTIDVPADVIQNFQDIVNNSSVSNIINNIIDANETLTILAYNPTTKMLTYKDEDGQTTTLDMAQLVTGNETVTTIVNNNDGTYTYTNEAGAQVTIDVPADVMNNFQDIISNTNVLNQLITNLTNTTVGGNVSYDGNSFTYVDNTGTTQTINIQDIVQDNQTVTTLVDNNNGTYTYTSEDGTVTTIDVPADVIQNFQDILNDSSVSNIINNIIDANETLTVLGYDTATKTLTYKDEDGNTTSLNMGQMVTGNETVTTLVNNNDGTYTYTNEAGAQVTIDVPADVTNNFQDIINNTSVMNQLITNLTNTTVGGNVSYNGTNFTYVDNTGTTQTINIQDIVQANETVTTLVNNNDGTYTYTNEAGAQVTIDVPADVMNNFQDIISNTSVMNQLITNLTNTTVGGNVSYNGTNFTYVDNTGTTQTINIQDIVQGNETVTTLVDNNNGTYTYTSEDGTVTTIDVPADVIQNFQDILNDSSVSNIINNIIDANETLTVLGYDTATKTLTYKDEDGNTTSLNMGQLVTGNETVTTLVNNNDGTYTYTNEAGAQVTIDVPADVTNNFQDIINNTDVLNQLITNLTNTTVGGNVSYDGNSFTYVDNTGTTQTINIQDIVQDNQTVTTLVDNNNGTYTYTSEDGTVTTIDVPADVIQNFQDILNDSSVSNIINNIIDANETLTVLGYDTATKTLTYKDEDGNTTSLNMGQLVTGNETVTTLVNNNDGTYTYTNEAGAQVTIDVPADVMNNFQDIINNTNVLNELITNLTNTTVGGNVSYDGNSFTYVDNTGTTQTINIQDIVQDNQTVTTLVDNNNGTYTYTSEDGTVTTIDVPADVIQNFQDIMNDSSVSNIINNIIDTNETLTVLGYDTATKKLTYKDEDGNTTMLDLGQLVAGNQTVTTLVDNNNGTYTYTSEDGTVTTIDVPADVIQNFQDIMNDSSVSNIINNIIDANETLTVLGYDTATRTLTYKDEDGNTTSLNMGQLVTGNETVTTLVNNNDGTYTYTNEAGAQVTIDVPADVMNNFQDIINNTDVLNQLITNLTNTTVGGNVSYDGNSFTYVDNTGTTQTINIQDIVQDNQTVTTLVDNNNGTYTYTSEDGTVTTIDVPADVIQNFQDILNDSSVSNIINNIIDANETLTVLGYDTATKTLTYKDEDGNTTSLNMGQLVTGNETVTTLVDNNNGTYTYTNEAGTITTINVPVTTVSNVSSNNNLTTTVNGTTGAAVNIINSNALSLNGSNQLVSTVNGQASTALNLAPAIAANDKTSSVLSGTAATVTSATTGNNTAYTVNVNTATAAATGAVKPGTGLTVAADGTLSVNTTGTGIGNNLTSNDLDITNGTGATLTAATANIKNGVITPAKLANAGNNQVLTTNASGTPIWVNQSALVPATTVSNLSSGNNLTTTVNGTTGIAVNIINNNALSLDGSNQLVSTVNGQASTALNLTPVIAANDKTSSVVNGTTTAVSSAISGNNTAYTVEVNPATTTVRGAVKAGAGLDVAPDGTLTVNINTIPNAADKTAVVTAGTNVTVAANTPVGSNTTEYTVSVPNTAIQNNQKTTTVSNGTNTTAAGTTVGNNTDYKVTTNAATNSIAGAVKPGTGLTVAVDGTLSVNTTGTGIGNNFSSNDFDITGGTGATLTAVTANIKNGAVTTTKMANSPSPNQVLVSNGTNAPTWVNQSVLVPAVTNTLTNNGTNTLTSTVNGVTATAPAVNTVANSLSGSSLTTTVNGVSGTALNLAPLVAANDKTSSVVNGTTTTVTSAVTGNNTAYTVEVNPTAIQSNQKTTSVTGSGLATVTSAITGNNTAYNVAVTATDIQGNQKLTTVSNGTNTTAVGTTTGNTTDYKVTANPATASVTGAVKPGTGLTVAADGTLSVNTSGTGIGNNFTSTDLNISNGTGATLTAVTANINNGVITPAKIANAGNNQVLTTSATGVPQWINQSILVPASTNTLTNNGTNTLTSTVNGITATAPAVNTVANSLSGSSLTTTVNGVSGTALNLAPLVAANDKTSSVVNGTTTTVTSAVTGNNTAYTVEVNPTAIQSNQKTTSVTGSGLATVTSAITGNNTAYNVAVTATDIQGNQKLTTVSNGTNTTVASTTTGNTTDYKVSVPTASTTLGVVKQASSNPTVNIAADGTLSVNTTATGLGKDLTTDGIIQVNSGNTLANSVLAGAALSIANNSIPTAKLADGAVTVAKIANAGNNQVLTTSATGVPQWINQSTLLTTTTTNTLTNNGTNTLTSTVNGVVTTAPAVNTVANSLSGSNLTTTVNGVSGTALNLAPVVAANDKTSSVLGGTATTVTSAVTGNNTAYTVNVNPATAAAIGAVKPGTGLTVAADGTLSVNTSGTGIGNNFTSTDLNITNGTGATLTAVTANINNGVITPAKIANAGNNQVLTTSATGAPQWVNQSTLTNNIYTTDGTIATARRVNLNALNLDFYNGTSYTQFTGNKILQATVSGARSGIEVGSGNSRINVFQDDNNFGQILASGATSSGLIVGTSLTLAKPLRLMTNGVMRMDINEGGNIGVGTLSSAANTYLLHVKASNATSDPLRLEGLRAGAVTDNLVVVTDANGVLKTTDFTTAVSEPWRVQGATTGATTNTQNIYQMGNVAIGAGATTITGTDASSKLFVNGTITTANSIYPDYVFEEYLDGDSKLNSDYSFKSLKEVETFINQNKHLPGVTGIKGLNKNEKGEYLFNISELTVQMLEKVEELYLHTIEQQKQLEAKDKELLELKDSAKSMDERLKRLEELLLVQEKK